MNSLGNSKEEEEEDDDDSSNERDSSSSESESSSSSSCDNILRSIESYEKGILYAEKHSPEQKKYKRSLALCHGHNHSNSRFVRDFGDIEFWYMIDSLEKTHPDYIADITDSDDMAYFDDSYFDCVVTMMCPQTEKRKFIQLLDNLHRIVSLSGLIYITGLYDTFHMLLTSEELQSLKDDILKLLGEITVKRFKKEWNDWQNDGLDDNGIYLEIIVGNYQRFPGFPSKYDLRKMIEERAKSIVNPIIESCNFVILEDQKKESKMPGEENTYYTVIQPLISMEEFFKNGKKRANEGGEQDDGRDGKKARFGNDHVCEMCENNAATHVTVNKDKSVHYLCGQACYSKMYLTK